MYYSPWRVGYIILWLSHISAEVLLVYSTPPGEWTIGHSLRGSNSFAEMLSVYSTAPGEWATGHTLWRSHPSVEVLSVYSTPSG